MKQLLYMFLFICFPIAIVTTSCSKDNLPSQEPTSEASKPSVVNFDPTEITFSSAKLMASITDNGGKNVTKRGFLISSTPITEPSINCGEELSCGDGSGDFTATVKELKESTKYYYVSYAKNENGYGFSSISSFTTLEDPNKVSDNASIVLEKLELVSMDYSSAGFDNGGTKYPYRMSYKISIDVKEYTSFQKAGFKIDTSIWSFNNVTQDGLYVADMATYSSSSTISVSVSSYGTYINGKEYVGNTETLSATYKSGDSGNTGGESGNITSKAADDTKAEYESSDNNDYMYITCSSLVSHLNRYGLTIYKSGASYYWKDFDQVKHYVQPGTSYSKKVYYYDSYISGKTMKTAYVYVSFRFSAF